MAPSLLECKKDDAHCDKQIQQTGEKQVHQSLINNFA